MKFQRLSGWRRALLFMGLLLVFAMWVFSFFADPVDGPGISTALSTPSGFISWLLLAAATLCFFITFYGTMPDKFLVLIPAGVTMNILVGALNNLVDWPFYGDTIGTMLAAIVGGPILGLTTGALTALAWGFSSPLLLSHVIVSCVVAVVVGLSAAFAGLSNMGRVLICGWGTGLMAAGLTWITVMWGLNGYTTAGTRNLVEFFQFLHVSHPSALLLQAVISEVLDKVLSLVGVAMVVRYAPGSVYGFFTYWGNARRMARVLRAQSEIEVADVARAFNQAAMEGALPAVEKPQSLATQKHTANI